MKEAIDVVKSEVKVNLLFWSNIKSHKFKVALVFLFIALAAL